MHRFLIVVGTVLIILQGCSDTTDHSTDLTAAYWDSEEFSYASNALARSGYCCNNGMPNAQRPDSLNTRLKWCFGDPDEESLSGKDCAILWSHYNLEMYQILGYQACGGEVDLYPRTPDWITGSTVNGNPLLEWGMVYNHYYRVERKVGNGSWSLLASLDNVIEDYLNLGDSTYTDLSVTTGTMSYNHYYRVKSDVSDTYSPSTDVIEYEVPVNVSISGPTSITTLQT
jgi:hypothetical protein